MRNRQIIQYLIYPRLFNAHSVLYKGTYTVSFKLYNITKNNTITYAYPFPVKNASNIKDFDMKGQPSIHSDGNFSYSTHKFEIIYEQQRKIIESQCIFRLDFQLSKEYNIFLNVRLLRKVTNSKSQEEAGLCVRKIYETKYQIINQQELELRKTSFSAYERIKFRSSQFFSSIDLFICNFNYGHKYYRNKMQISNFFTNVDLHNNNALGKMKEKCDTTEKKLKKEDILYYRYELMKNFECGIPSFYYQLLKMIEQYRRLMIQYENLHSSLQKNDESQNLPVSSLIDLEHIKMKDPKVCLQSLQIHYDVSSPQEILCFIFEEKEFIRKNIRCLRQQFCLLLTYQSERDFFHLVNASMSVIEEMEEKLFVKYVSDLSHLEDSSQNQLRIDNISTFKRDQALWNKKIMNMPLFFVQNYQKKERNSRSSKKKINSLTVFVHGYQGNSFDFQKAKNYLKENNKNTHVLIIESITNEMNQSIEFLGKEAADQVTRFIQNTIINFNQINFIGFSLGGIIARSAFTYLQQYWNKFNMFITFSSPHLGISQCENSLVNIGIWYLIKIDKVKNLKQLNFQSVKFSQSTLSKLSKCQGLSQFKKVVLVCSKNDGFVPFYSTVLESKRCERQQIKQLCQNIIKKIKHVERVEMLFDIQNSGTLDKLTGRRGHIQFLDNDYFLDIFFRLYAPSL